MLLVFGRAELSCNISEYDELMDVFKTIYIDPSNIFSTSVYEKYSTLVLKNINFSRKFFLYLKNLQVHFVILHHMFHSLHIYSVVIFH